MFASHVCVDLQVERVEKRQKRLKRDVISSIDLVTFVLTFNGSQGDKTHFVIVEI